MSSEFLLTMQQLSRLKRNECFSETDNLNFSEQLGDIEQDPFIGFIGENYFQSEVKICFLGKANAPTKDLLDSLDRKQISIKADVKQKNINIQIDGVSSVENNQDGYIDITYQPSKTNFFDILQQLENQDISIIDIISKETDLEDIFLEFIRENKK